jgi:hypothetical protein
MMELRERQEWWILSKDLSFGIVDLL